jgi:hypothetical protein
MSHLATQIARMFGILVVSCFDPELVLPRHSANKIVSIGIDPFLTQRALTQITRLILCC